MATRNTARSDGRSSRNARKEDEDRNLVDRFLEVSDGVTEALGTPWALAASVLLIGVWAFTGPLFRFSDTWQLVINTATTIITFWMVFVIQTSQNRQSKAVQFKLDELIRSIPGARNQMIEAERQSTAELKRQEQEFQKTAERGGVQGVPPEEVADEVRSKGSGR
jgi:low affinity Fe/Cu permease